MHQYGTKALTFLQSPGGSLFHSNAIINAYYLTGQKNTSEGQLEITGSKTVNVYLHGHVRRRMYSETFLQILEFLKYVLK